MVITRPPPHAAADSSPPGVAADGPIWKGEDTTRESKSASGESKRAWRESWTIRGKSGFLWATMTHHMLTPLLLLTLAIGPLRAEDPALQPGTRELPGAESTTLLRYANPEARQVAVRESGSWWMNAHELVFTNQAWQISTTDLGWSPGFYEFKFLVDGVWEEGPNRHAYVGADGNLQRPPALYLCWQRDPATTMTVQWHGNTTAETARVAYRPRGGAEWQAATGSTFYLSDLGRFVHTVEITGLEPGGAYDFHAGNQPGHPWFRTLPAHLQEPLHFVEGGDVYEIGPVMDAMNRLAASRDPAFVVLGGDLAYANGMRELAPRWYRYFASLSENLVTPEGRVIPVLHILGNHEVQNHYLENHPDYAPGPAWREKVAPHFFRLFAFPGQPGYRALDAGDYLSLVVLDSHLANPADGDQLTWLRETLAARRQVPHVFPIYHVPAYPSVRTPNDPRSALIRALWVPLFETSPIRLAFEHHDHAFKVTFPLRGGKPDHDGIVYVGDGAWGVNLRTPNTQPEHTTYLRKSMPIHHLYDVILTTTSRTIRALSVSGEELDSFSQAVATP